MSSSLKLLCVMFLLHVFSTGRAASQNCDLSSVQVLQRNTGNIIGVDPVFEVEVKNSCSCAVEGVFLFSMGFASSVVVDPKLFRREGENYLVNDGRSVASNQSVKFLYAWDRAFFMSPASFSTKC